MAAAHSGPSLDIVLASIEFGRQHAHGASKAQIARVIFNEHGNHLRARYSESELRARLGADLFEELDRDEKEKDVSRKIGTALKRPAAVPSSARSGDSQISARSGDSQPQIGQDSTDGSETQFEERFEDVVHSHGSDVPDANWTLNALRVWLQANCVKFNMRADKARLLELAIYTQSEIEEEARALAAFEQTVAVRQAPQLVVSQGHGGKGTVLDAARAGEEQARREMLKEAQERKDLTKDKDWVRSFLSRNDMGYVLREEAEVEEGGEEGGEEDGDAEKGEEAEQAVEVVTVPPGPGDGPDR